MTTKAILRLDIETIPLHTTQDSFEESRLSDIRENKYCKEKPQDITPRERYRERASLHAEFGKIVCISMVYEVCSSPSLPLVTKNIIGDDEKELLTQMSVITNKWMGLYGGHNAKGYDVPFIVKRMIGHGINPGSLYQGEKKPREQNIIDTLDIFKMGGRASTGLDLMCQHMGLHSPKDIMSGSEVKEQRKIRKEQPEQREEIEDKLSQYCLGDATASMECYKKIQSILYPHDEGDKEHK